LAGCFVNTAYRHSGAPVTEAPKTQQRPLLSCRRVSAGGLPSTVSEIRTQQCHALTQPRLLVRSGSKRLEKLTAKRTGGLARAMRAILREHLG
jgi:hypothetical protein